MKRILLSTSMCLLIISPLILADTIYIHNKSDITVYGAPYKTSTISKRTQAPKAIKPHSSATFERPSFSFDLSGRRFAFSARQQDITPSLTEDALRLLRTQDISGPLNDNFYIDLVKGHLEGFNAINWRFYQPIKNKVITPVLANLAALTTGQLRKNYLIPPYNAMNAQLRVGTGLSAQEKAYRKKRSPATHSALQRFTQTAITPGKEPVVAACISGGGLRSALAATGFLNGLEKIGLFDGITYISTLSGSTWALGSWISLQMSLAGYKNKLISQANAGLFNPKFTLGNLKDALFKKFVLGRPISMVDVYGLSLGSIFLNNNNNNPDTIYLSEQTKRTATATIPYPIYTGMLTKKPYEWVEFTPDEIGCNYLGGYVPSWAFGREFINGASTHNTPPESLGFMYGIFGYAIGLNLGELVAYAKKSLPSFLFTILNTTAEETPLGRQRIFPAQVLNFTYGKLQLPRGSQETLTLIDLGILHNVPLQPLLERKERAIDIIIICDNSDYSMESMGTELHKAVTYFKQRGIKLPHIDYEKIKYTTCSVFKDYNDPTVPVIIYMPLIKNDRFSASFNPAHCLDTFCATFNFNYQKNEAQLIADLAEYNVIANKTLLSNTIKEVIAKKASDSKGNRKNGRMASRRAGRHKKESILKV